MRYMGYSSTKSDNINTSVVNDDAVIRDLVNHFNTRLGERVSRPDFGSIIHELVFEVMDEQLETVIIDDVSRVVGQDPRVDLIDTKVGIDQYSITVNVKVNIKELNTVKEFDLSFSPT